METLLLDDFYTILEPWSDIKNTHILGTFSKSHQVPHLHEENVQKHHVVLLEFLIFWCRVTLEPLNDNTSFQSHIVEQHKSYRMVVESWESVQANQNVPLFARGTFCERLWIACTKTFTTELMDVSGLWDLNEKKVEEMLYLLVFVWSPRSERWPGRKK